MSKAALSFLMLTLASTAAVWLFPHTQHWVLAGKLSAGLFGLLFLGALLIGRKIKFDPVLRG